MIDNELVRLRTDLGLKRLGRAWAKAEIVIGLASMWLSFHFGELVGAGDPSKGPVLISLGLFVAGGYLAMAGSRSHLYQSNNRLAAFVVTRLKQLP